MVVKLKPIVDRHAYSRHITRELMNVWRSCLFDKLLSIIRPIEQYFNDINVLMDAISKHKIRYVDGGFVGKFNAQISKELVKLGAKFDKRKNKYMISRDKLPQSIKHAISMAHLSTLQMYKEVLDFLNSYNPRQMLGLIDDVLDWPLHIMLEDLGEQARKTIENAIKVKVQFFEDDERRFKQQYSEDIKKSVKNFTDQQVVRLRQMVENSLLHGAEDEPLITSIQKEFNVTYNKAKFLARQETGLLVAKYRQLTYNRVGINKYQWSTSHDERVRKMHKDLDGKIFEFDNPPTTNEKGDKNNPGEDWQCRCQPIPIFDNVVQ